MSARTRIVIDTREQRGYTWDPDPATGEPTTTAAALPAGDYSIEGLETRVAIERKSLEDFIGTVLRSKERFIRELVKLRGYEFAAVVIESSAQDIAAGNYTSQINPDALMGLLAHFMVLSSPVHFVLAGDRPNARVITEKLLRFAERQIAEREGRDTI